MACRVYLSHINYQLTFDKIGVYGKKLLKEELYAIIITQHAGMFVIIYILVIIEIVRYGSLNEIQKVYFSKVFHKVLLY